MSLPEIIGGKYRPRRILGTGSTGTVYSVEHTLTGQSLALKVMTSHLGGSPEAVARFKREAFVVSKIRSRHVVRIFDADVSAELNGAPYLVMDLLEGIDLEQLSDDKPIQPQTVVSWLRQVADPLDKAHRIGIIHRDLKPENLFLTREEDGAPLIKILDFGIARIASESMSIGATQWGQLLGTPLYMAPEQARGDPTQVGPTTDLYALGLIAYKLLAGTSYRTGTTLTVMLEEILRGPLRAPSEIGPDFSPEFDCWFLRACHPEPTRRFTSAGQQVEALARAFGLPAEAEMLPSPSSGPKQSFTRDLGGAMPDFSDGGRLTPTVVVMADPKPTVGGDRAALMSPSPPSTTYVSAPPRRNGWRAAFFAAAGAVLLLLIAFYLWRPKGQELTSVRDVPPGVPAAPPHAPLADSRASAANPPAPMMSEAISALSPSEPAPSESAAKPPPPRVYPVVRAWTGTPVRARVNPNDDPLSDQQ